MKTILLKLALCAFAALPIGAWADDEVNTAALWTFENLENNHQYASYSAINSSLPTGEDAQTAYLRTKVTGRSFTVTTVTGDVKIVLADGTKKSITQSLKTNNNMTNYYKGIPATTKANDQTDYACGAFAFDASVAGTVYVWCKANTTDAVFRIYHTEKTTTGTVGENTSTTVLLEGGNTGKMTSGQLMCISYTSTNAGTFILGNVAKAAEEIYAVQFVPTPASTPALSTAKNFLTGLPVASVNAVTYNGDGLVYRANTSSNKQISFEDYDGDAITFSDGESITPSRIATTAGTIEVSSWTMSTYDPMENNGSRGTPMVAFKTAIPGKIYVKFLINSASNSEKGNFRIYYSNGTSAPTQVKYSENYYSNDGIKELVYDEAAAGSYFLGSNKACKIYGVRFVPKTYYTLTVNAENGTVTRSPEKSKYNYNEVVTLTATPADGYRLVSWTGVDSSDGATATVTMNADKNVTATFVRNATTVWNFDQYMGNDEIVISGQEKKVKNIDGLYIHINGRSGVERSFKAKVGKTKMAIYNNASSGTASGKSYTASQEDADLMGIAYETPSAGTFSVDVYAVYDSGEKRGVDVYSNGTKIDDSSTSLETETSTTISYTASGVETIYIVPTGGALYFEEFRFVPTTADKVTKTVTLKGEGGGYATFSATQNYDLPADVSAYIVSNVSDKKATMTEINEIPACTGVILYKEGVSSDTEITLTSKETTKVDVSSNWLKANIADYILPANDGTNYNYTLAAGPVFKHVKDTGTVDERTLAAGKAFLRTTESGAGARSFELVFDDDETTGIKAIEPSQYTNDIYFNLAGQRVEKPTKGLYIVNGKKVVIK